MEHIEFQYKKPIRKKHSIIAETTRLVNQVFNNYIRNAAAYVANCKIYDPYSGEDLPPDEEFMQSIEKHLPLVVVDEFRKRMVNLKIDFALKWNTDINLARALLQKVYLDHPHGIGFTIK